MNTFKNIRKSALTAGLAGLVSISAGCNKAQEKPYIPSGCDYAIEYEENGKKNFVQIQKNNLVWEPNFLPPVPRWVGGIPYRGFEEATLRSDCPRYAVFHNGDFHAITKENLLVAPDGLGYVDKDGKRVYEE